MSEARAPNDVAVRGGASAEELAALLAVVSRVEPHTPQPDAYTRWRRTRLAALRRVEAAPG